MPLHSSDKAQAKKPIGLHDHHKHRQKNKKRLITVLILTVLFFFAEIIGGVWTNSLALLADAGHMLSDVAALSMSLFAIWISLRPAHKKKTYGYYRAEILAAFLNGAILMVIAFLIFFEAFERLQYPEAVKSLPMLGIATLGLLVNLIGAFVLHGAGKENINVRGAFLHVVGDALGSLGAMSAAAVIWLTGWMWFDPFISFFIGSIIIYSAWRLLWDTVHILMQGVPPYIDIDEIKNALLDVEGVTGLCDLHVWTLTSHVDMLSAHVVVKDVGRSMNILKDIQHLLRDKYGLEHTTVQIEDESFGTCKFLF